MMLAKIILLGNYWWLGERFGEMLLIFKILCRAFAMSRMALFFSILEYAVEGLWFNRDIAGICLEIPNNDKGELLAHTAVMFINFIPLFVIWETGRLMGGNKLFQMLFKHRTASTTDTEDI